jgi:hypothetical protein
VTDKADLETSTIQESFGLYAEATGMTWEQFQESLASRTHTRRLSTLEEMAKRGGLHGFRQGERDDGNHRQPDPWEAWTTNTAKRPSDGALA